MAKKKKKIIDVPESLRKWFIVHFVIDILFAIPLIFFPLKLFNFFEISNVDPLMSGLVGAALIGIGGASLLNHKRNKESYLIMLELKLLWSAAAILVLAYSIFKTGTTSLIFVLILFVFFFLLWLYYRNKMV